MPFARTLKLPAIGLLATLAFLAGCARAGHPRIANPTHIVSFCGFRVPRPSALLSILTSTSDRPPAAPAPSLAEIRARAKRTSGAIARWDAPQRVEFPNLAHAFGESDAFVEVRGEAVVPPPSDAQTRPIWLEVRDHGAWRWVELQAYDRQDVCTEGQRTF